MTAQDVISRGRELLALVEKTKSESYSPLQHRKARILLGEFANEHIKDLLDVAEAAQKRVNDWHSSGCSSLLLHRKDCDCGHDELAAALNKMKGERG